MTFYTGNLEYHFRFETGETGEYHVQVRQFVAPLLSVSVDGEDKGLIAFAPHRISLGNLSAGEHELTICLYGNRHNGFGYLHNANEDYTW